MKTTKKEDNKFHLLQRSGFKIQCVVNELHVKINLGQACTFP